jgi:serine protease Do
VERDSPAQQAGLAEGDLVVAIEGQAISSIDDLHRQLTIARIGVECALTVLHDGQRQEIRVTPRERA